MTNKAAVIASVYITGYTSDVLDLAIEKYGLNPDATFTADQTLLVNKAAIDILDAMKSIKKVQEGGYTIEYSEEGIKARIDFLNGVSGSAPQLRNKSFMW